MDFSLSIPKERVCATSTLPNRSTVRPGKESASPKIRRQQEEIRAFVRQGLKRVRRYGRFPLRTAIGYRLFLACPGIYRKLLNRVKSENGKQ